MDRCPSVQAVVAACRVLQWAQAAAGQRGGTSGNTLGTAPHPWALSEAAALCLRHNPAGPKGVARVENKHGKGKALTMLAHQLARAVYDRLKRQTAFAVDKCLQSEGRRTGAPDASLETSGISLLRACSSSYYTASLNATVRIGPISQALGCAWPPALALVQAAIVAPR